ncbi:MAG: flagellar hook-length control protein FliK [Spirochaetaceae bacterium]|nr:MAG: flagellar hook-length control protein FliK [Spirochaetaceae bacterium]
MDFTSPKIVKADASAETSASPAAQALSEKKPGGKVEQGLSAFARSLEKAKEANQGKAVRSKVGNSPTEALAMRGGKALIDPSKILQELLAGLNAQELTRVLMQFNPKELLRFAESFGFDKLALLDSAKALDTTPVAAKWGRDRISNLRKQLVEILGKEGALKVIAAAAGKKRVAPTPEIGLKKPAKNQPVGEARSVGKKPRVVVLDLRKDAPAAGDVQNQGNALKNPSAGEKIAETQDREASILYRTPIQERAPASAADASSRVSRLPINFEQRFIPEVVKQTGIILKGSDSGEIRLVLKPENLGSLRIRLSLSESSLEGRIVVDNNSVKELVESSLDNLRNALRLEGYQTSLEVFVGHRRSGNGNQESAPASWRNGGSEEFEKSVPLFLEMKPDYELINVFA